MTLEILSAIGNHLWQSTLLLGAVGVMVLSLKKNRAAVRYRLWLIASLKFLLPLSLLVTLGRVFEWRTGQVPAPPGALVSAVEGMSQPFSFDVVRMSGALQSPAVESDGVILATLFFLWFCGAAVAGWHWLREWSRLRSVVQKASPVDLGIPIPVLMSSAALEPGIFGVFRPSLVLPRGLLERLTSSQLDAVVAHELCHVRRRDNLAAVVHMFIETIFWFHPLVWWLGKRLVEERERACDEAVLSGGGDSETYAEGILSVCKFYKESSLPCVSGVTGANLTTRIEEIMRNSRPHRLNPAKVLFLVMLALAAFGGPIALGVLRGMAQPAQGRTDPVLTLRPKFEVASIRPTASVGPINTPPGRFIAAGTSIEALIGFAYGMRTFEVFGEPDWTRQERWVIEAKSPDGDVPSSDTLHLMLQSLLEDRFALKVHRETREMPMYELVVNKGGPKLRRSVDQGPVEPPPVNTDGLFLTIGPDGRPLMKRGVASVRLSKGGLRKFEAKAVPLSMLLNFLVNWTGRTVIDKTNLTGLYDMELDFVLDNLSATPEESPVSVGGTPLPAALQNQLGLRLESTKGASEVLVIDHVERPSEN